jgi:hypothetical protein
VNGHRWSRSKELLFGGFFAAVGWQRSMARAGFLSPANDPDGPGESRKKRFGIPSAFTFILGSDSGRAAAASSSRDEANRLVYKQHEQRTVIGCRCSRPADYATGADEKRC